MINNRVPPASGMLGGPCSEHHQSDGVQVIYPRFSIAITSGSGVCISLRIEKPTPLGIAVSALEIADSGFVIESQLVPLQQRQGALHGQIRQP